MCSLGVFRPVLTFAAQVLERLGLRAEPLFGLQYVDKKGFLSFIKMEKKVGARASLLRPPPSALCGLSAGPLVLLKPRLREALSIEEIEDCSFFCA